MPIFNWLIVLCWVVFVFVWIISAMGTKRIVRSTNPWMRFGVSLLLVVLLVAFTNNSELPEYFIPQSTLLGVVAVIFCALGIAFAVWARIHLGKNWSPTPSIQEDHELVTSGPYQFVRHPIYTGLILALIGTALISGTIWFMFCVVIILMFLWRVHIEERFMTETFPNHYPEYKKRTKALVPFVW